MALQLAIRGAHHACHSRPECGREAQCGSGGLQDPQQQLSYHTADMVTTFSDTLCCSSSISVCCKVVTSCGSGCSAQYNPLHMFGYTIGGQTCDMVFTSVLGHLQQLDFTSSHTKWYSCNPSELYTAPVVKSVAEVGHSNKRDTVLLQAANSIVCIGVSQVARQQPAALSCNSLRDASRESTMAAKSTCIP